MVSQDRLDDLRRDIGEDGLAELLPIFLAEADELVALLDPNEPDLCHTLHALKGCAVNIGLDGVHETCMRIESDIAADRMSRCAIADLRDGYSRARQELIATLGLAA